MHWFSDGGAERMTIFLANALCEKGYEVSFLIRHNDGAMKPMLHPDINVLDMKLPRKGKIIKNLRNIIYLRKAMSRKETGILFSITAEMSQVAAIASLTCHKRVPLVSVVHNTLSQETHSFQKVREFLYPFLNRRYDKVVAISETVAQDYRKLCYARERQVEIISNPVISDEVFRLAGLESGHPWLASKRSWKTLVQAGRLSEQKNHRLSFQALAMLRKKEDYRLILLGIGEKEMELRKLSRDLQIEDAVDFVGYVYNPYAYFREADALILSSRYEGLPTVLIEGLACGSRIVSVDCPSGPYEILEGGRLGTLVPMEDPDGLAEGIRKSMEKEPDRQQLRKRALDFTREASVKKYIRLIDRLQEEST